MRKNVSKGVNGSTCNLVSKSKLLNRSKKEKRQMIAAFCRCGVYRTTNLLFC